MIKFLSLGLLATVIVSTLSRLILILLDLNIQKVIEAKGWDLLLKDCLEKRECGYEIAFAAFESAISFFNNPYLIGFAVASVIFAFWSLIVRFLTNDKKRDRAWCDFHISKQAYLRTSNESNKFVFGYSVVNSGGTPAKNVEVKIAYARKDYFDRFTTEDSEAMIDEVMADSFYSCLKEIVFNEVVDVDINSILIINDKYKPSKLEFHPTAEEVEYAFPVDYIKYYMVVKLSYSPLEQNEVSSITKFFEFNPTDLDDYPDEFFDLDLIPAELTEAKNLSFISDPALSAKL